MQNDDTRTSCHDTLIKKKCAHCARYCSFLISDYSVTAYVQYLRTFILRISKIKQLSDFKTCLMSLKLKYLVLRGFKINVSGFHCGICFIMFSLQGCYNGV